MPSIVVLVVSLLIVILIGIRVYNSFSLKVLDSTRISTKYL